MPRNPYIIAIHTFSDVRRITRIMGGLWGNGNDGRCPSSSFVFFIVNAVFRAGGGGRIRRPQQSTRVQTIGGSGSWHPTTQGTPLWAQHVPPSLHVLFRKRARARTSAETTHISRFSESEPLSFVSPLGLSTMDPPSAAMPSGAAPASLAGGLRLIASELHSLRLQRRSPGAAKSAMIAALIFRRGGLFRLPR